MAQTPQEWLAGLCADAGLEADVTAKVLASVDKTAPRINTLLQHEDNLRAERGRVAAAETRLREYGEWYGTASAEYERMQAELNTLKTRPPSPAVPAAPPIDTSKFATKADIDNVIANSVTAIKQVGALSSRHALKFQEELDVDALDKFATAKNIPVIAAYDLYIAPRLAEAEKLKQAEAIKAAKEEGAREALSKHRLPVDVAPPQAAPIYARHDPAASATIDIDAEMMDAWNTGKA